MKNMKKLLSTVLTFALVLSMNTVAFAENAENKTYEDMSTVTLKKTYKLVGNNETAVSPAETFTFSELVCTEVKDAGVGVTKENAPVPTIASVSYDLGEAGKETATKEITITLPTYDAVGVYTYTFEENDGATAGVTYREDDITLVVTVIEQDGKVRVAAVHTEGENSKKSNQFDNTYSAGSLEVSKVVTGILGDQDKDFTVTVTFTAPEGDTVKSDITYKGYQIKDENAVAVAAGEGWTGTKTVTICLKNDSSVTFENIPYGVTYTVVENDYTGEGYDKAVYEYDDLNKVIDSAVDTVSITNNKGGTVDTGITMDSVPYIVLLAVVCVGFVGFISKKRTMDEM